MAKQAEERLTRIIRDFREDARISPKDAAMYLNIPINKYNAYEAGDSRISIGNLFNLARYYRVSVDALLKGEKTETRIKYEGDKEIEVIRTRLGEEEEEEEEKEEDSPDRRDSAPVQAGTGAAREWKDILDAPRKIVEWQKGFSSGTSFFDVPRKELFQMTNNLYTANLIGGWDFSRYIFEDSIRYALRYMKDMRNEETLMRKCNYPGYAAHRKEHILYILEIQRLVDMYRAKHKIDIKSYVLFLKDWALGHMSITDRQMILYLTMLKRRGVLNQIILLIKKLDDGSLIIK
jgi:hemerythrin-like metal-binding protein